MSVRMVCLCLCTAVLLAGADRPKKVDVPSDVSLSGVKIAEPFPPSLQLSSSHQTDGRDGTFMGLFALFSNPTNKDVISIMTQQADVDWSNNDTRHAAAQAYVSATTRSLADRGARLLKMTPENLDDIPTDIDFSKEQCFFCECVVPDRSTIYVRVKVFFSDKAFCVTTMAYDVDRFAELNRLADGVKPKQ